MTGRIQICAARLLSIQCAMPNAESIDRLTL